MPGIEVVVTLVLLTPAVWLMERTHRRMRPLPHRRLGVAEDSQEAIEYRRELRELRIIAQRSCPDQVSDPRLDQALRSL